MLGLMKEQNRNFKIGILWFADIVICIKNEDFIGISKWRLYDLWIPRIAMLKIDDLNFKNKNFILRN